MPINPCGQDNTASFSNQYYQNGAQMQECKGTTRLKKRNNPEKKIENWLIKNLEKYEQGLTFVRSQHKNMVGDWGHNRFDILAVDKDGIFVIIEVKVRVSHWAIDTQLPTYMKNFGVPCRGIAAGVKISRFAKSMEMPENISVWDLGGAYGKN
jgi:RecB family endonuclease NucS